MLTSKSPASDLDGDGGIEVQVKKNPESGESGFSVDIQLITRQIRDRNASYRTLFSV